MAALTDTELSAIISKQVALARNHDRTELDKTRTKALDYFFGRMDAYVPPEPNRSKVVSRDVADTIGWMMPQLMRVFTASDKFVEAEPVEEGDVKFAKQATDGLNHVFWKDNDGYKVCYNAAWDALLFSDGIVKTYYDDTPQYAVSFHSGLTEDQVALLLAPNEDGEEPEVLASDDRIELVEDETGNQVPVKVWDCKIRRVKAKGRFVIEAIPPEDFLKDSEATSTDDAVFQCHRDEKTRSELIEMGFDRDKVRAIPVGAQWGNSEQVARNPITREDSPDTSTELVDLYECYVKIDVDGDGVAETVRAYFAGGENGTLLDWEVWDDETPFDNIPCEPVPHRFEGRSMFDETQDIMDVKTVLIRQLLNNMYASNNPQRFVKGKIHNPEELMSPSFNGAIFGDASSEIVPLPVPLVAANALEGIAYMDEVVQRRTGIGRQSMALDPEALQNQSATANQNNKDAAYSQVELVARNMAEWGWRKVFRKLLRLMVKHQDTPRTIRLRGDQFTTIDPRHWNADMDVTINVGLGTGSRDRDMMMLQQVLMNQLGLADRFMASGATEQAIDMLPKIIATMTKIAESAGLRNPDEYYPDNAEEIVAALKQKAAEAGQQPPPEIQIEQLKGENAKALKEVDAQVSMRESELKAQGDVIKNKAELEADLQTKEADRQNALMLEQQKQAFEREKLQAEYQFKMMELAQKRELELLKMGMQEGEGEDGKKSVKSKADMHNEKMTESVALLQQALAELQSNMGQLGQMMSAPTEIVRDPATGRAIGTRKVLN